MNDFVKISKYAGMREDLVQAGGGNTSYKEASDRMYIKASGYSLADVSLNEGYSIVDPSVIADTFMNSDNMASLTEEDGKKLLNSALIEGKKPSIETFLHSVSGKYTLHSHPITVNILASRKGGMREIKNLFPDAVCIPYATPGIELAKGYFSEITIHENRSGTAVFLQNHGLIVSGDSGDEVIFKTEQIIKKIESLMDLDMDKYHKSTSLWQWFGNKIIWAVSDKNILETYKSIGIWEHEFCPDCVVYLGKRILSLNIGNEINQIEYFKKKYGNPVVIEYGNDLYIVADNVKGGNEK